MRQIFPIFSAAFILPALLLSDVACVSAQTATQGARVSNGVVASDTITLNHTTARMMRPTTDGGAVSAGQTMGRMLLLLKPSESQSAALESFLGDLQNPASANYHHWLTPEQFGATYGPAQADITAITDWLTSEGFAVAGVSAGRQWIEFSGTVAQVETAFHTEIHSYATSGQQHLSNSSDIQIPAALAPVVAGVVSLGSIESLAAHTKPLLLATNGSSVAHPLGSAAHALAPQDLAGIYNLNPIYAAGVNGAGQTIAIASRSNINLADVAAFRKMFGLSANAPKVIVNGADPGQTADSAEALLDTSWTGAVAPRATIDLVASASTSATDGVDLSLAYIVDHNLAPVMSISYVSCEATLSGTRSSFYSSAYKQAAAQGMTVIVAAGDSGAAACEDPSLGAAVSTGYGVNGLASTPYNVAVGGTAFADGSLSTNAYIAEQGWNTASVQSGSYAGGGGVSTLYAKPSWQVAGGVPTADPNGAENHRYLPDVSLAAAQQSSGISSGKAGYALCSATEGADCEQNQIASYSGTSAATAVFAGMMALVNQGTQSIQGNAAPALYSLSRISGVFHDVASGSQTLPCANGTADCGTTGTIGYNASEGYDLATGLGSVDATALVAGFKTLGALAAASANAVVTLTPTQLSITPTQVYTLSVTVASGTGSGPIPTGTITFYDQQSGTLGTAQLNSLGTTSYSASGNLPLGGNTIIAEYSGDTTYLPVNSGPSVVTVAKSATTAVVVPSTTSPAPGSSFTATTTVSAAPGQNAGQPPTGTVNFTLDGTTVGSAQLSTLNGSQVATVTLSAPSSGTHVLTAVYAGDASYAGSTAPSVTISGTKANTATTLTPSSPTPPYGSTVTLTAAITTPGVTGVSVTGSVTFTLDGVVVGSAQVTGNAGAQTAALAITAPAIGSHLVSANYAGDTNNNASTSAPVTLNVQKGRTITTITAAPAILAKGIPEIFTAAISNATTVAGGTFTFTGSVQFYDGATPLGIAVPVSNNTAVSPSINLDPTISHAITAVYSGDATWTDSTSNLLTLTPASNPTTVLLTANTTSGLAGSVLTFTVTVTPALPATPQVAPTGLVVLYNGTTAVASATLVPGVGLNAAATFNVATLPYGGQTITAHYLGDTNYKPGTSNAVTVFIQDFTATAGGTNFTLTQGGTLTVPFAVNSYGGLSEMISVTCDVPPNTETSCSFSPNAIVANGSTMLTITSTGTHTITPTVANGKRGVAGLFAMGGGASFAFILLTCLPLGRRTLRFRSRLFQSAAGQKVLLGLLLITFLAAGVGCGGYQSNLITDAGTPLGVSTFNITSSALVNNVTVSHRTYITVNVVPAS